MLLPNRHGSTDSYRYGFQGMEKDDEVKGEGNSLNYAFRMYDTRIGRFFAADPLEKQYPYYTPYQFAGNKVIAWRELEGLEEVLVIQSPYVRDAVIGYKNNNDVNSAVSAAYNSYIWTSEAQVNHAKQTFDVGQEIGDKSTLVLNSKERDRGIEVYSYTDAGEYIKLFSVGVTPLFDDIKQDKQENSWIQDLEDWVNTLRGNEKLKSTHEPNIIGFSLNFKGSGEGILGNYSGSPIYTHDISEVMDVLALNNSGSNTTKFGNAAEDIMGESSKIMGDTKAKKEDAKPVVIDTLFIVSGVKSTENGESNGAVQVLQTKKEQDSVKLEFIKDGRTDVKTYSQLKYGQPQQ